MMICLQSAQLCKPIGLVNLSVGEEMSYSVYIEHFAYINGRQTWPYLYEEEQMRSVYSVA